MLRPLGDRVIVKRIKEPEQLASGLYVPAIAQKGSVEGEVVAVGPGRVLDNGVMIPVDLVVGDKVLFMEYGGHEIEKEGEKFLVFKEAEILAKFEKEV